MLFMVMSLLLRAEQRVDACDLAADAAHVVGLGELAGGLLHAQRELLLLQLAHVGLPLVGPLHAELPELLLRTVRVPSEVVTVRARTSVVTGRSLSVRVTLCGRR